jgi:hypothetical protein
MGLKLVRIGEDKPSPLLWTGLASRFVGRVGVRTLVVALQVCRFVSPRLRSRWSNELESMGWLGGCGVGLHGRLWVGWPFIVEPASPGEPRRGTIKAHPSPLHHRRPYGW